MAFGLVNFGDECLEGLKSSSTGTDGHSGVFGQVICAMSEESYELHSLHCHITLESLNWL